MLSCKFNDMFPPPTAIIRYIYDDSRKLLYCIVLAIHPKRLILSRALETIDGGWIGWIGEQIY
jgi:hypothetical protein